MNILIPFRYPEDRTGISPDNLVAGEVQALSARSIRCISPLYGAYYKESLIIEDEATGIALVPGTEYECIEYAEMPSLFTGKEIFTVIVIYKPGVTSVKLTYQALGGPASHSMDAVVRMIEALDLDNRPVYWPDIIGKPKKYPPAPHFHDAGDIYGFEYITSAIYELRNAVLLGDTVSHDEIYTYVDKTAELLTEVIDALRADLAEHEQDRENPHEVTKLQVGLGKVEDFPLATIDEAKAGTINTGYMTPALTAEAITALAIPPLNAHIADTSNPHKTTKAQVGLGLVDNFATATNAQAALGSAINLFVTPAGVRAAIAAQASDGLAAHISNTNNPHNVTKLHVGLGSVYNYGLASTRQAEEGTATNVYMTPATTLAAIKANASSGSAFTTPVSTTGKFLTESYTNGGGYSFLRDPGYDTGMFSDKADVVDLMVAGQLGLQLTTKGLSTGKSMYFSERALAMIASDWPNQGSVACHFDSTAVSDWQCSGQTFSTTGYQIRLGLRSDGLFGIGGASRAAWSWYTDAAGNAVAAGDVVAYSDPALKENFNRVDNAHEILSAINGYTFEWRSGIPHTSVKAGKRDYGVNAREVLQVAPEMVADSAEIDGQKYLTVAYEKLIPVLIEAVKSSKNEIDTLTKEMTLIKQQIADFSKMVDEHGEQKVARLLQAGGMRRSARGS